MTPECSNCDEWVSQAFARVLSVDGEVRACPRCAPKNIPDVKVYGGGEHSTASRATQSQRARGGR